LNSAYKQKIDAGAKSVRPFYFDFLPLFTVEIFVERRRNNLEFLLRCFLVDGAVQALPQCDLCSLLVSVSGILAG
jgi:hypothetical protein